MRKFVLTYGLIAGAILSALMLLTIPFMDRIGFDRSMVLGYTSMVLAFLMVFFGVRSYRDRAAGGSVSFGRAFMVGLLITLVGTVCYVATWQFVYHKLTPDFLDRYAEYSLEKSRKAGADEAALARKAKELEDYKVQYRNPLVNVAYTFLEPLPVGLVFTLVTAGTLGRRRRPAQTGPLPAA